MYIYQINVDGHECVSNDLLASHDEHSPERFAEIVQDAINTVKGPKIEFQKKMKARYFEQNLNEFTSVLMPDMPEYLTKMRDGDHELHYYEIRSEVLAELKDAWGFFDVTITAEVDKGEDEVIEKYKL